MKDLRLLGMYPCGFCKKMLDTRKDPHIQTRKKVGYPMVETTIVCQRCAKLVMDGKDPREVSE